MRLDDDVAAQTRVVAEKHRLGRDQRGAGQHGGAAQPLLDHPLRVGELRAIVDALHFRLRAPPRRRLDGQPGGRAATTSVR